ncbi:hypothetical protein [Caryophanon tenue]|uniref:hypothetical protein n=1 Tax=Caryophanon tenue TaxID=33978 RepID=UPI0009FF6496|nr:hypothetical protein [Caryophanon tenue]
MKLESINIEETELIFYYPVTYRMSKRQELLDMLSVYEYEFFSLEDEEKRQAYYGGHTISHQALQQFFYPFLEDKLFPEKPEHRSFSRFSKAFYENGVMDVRGKSVPFTLSSVDLTLAPFGLAFIAVRIVLHERTRLSDVLDFCHFFRVLVPHLDEEKGALYTYNGNSYSRVDHLLKTECYPFLEQFFVDYEKLGKHYSHMPFFEDERMFVSGFLRTEQGQQIDETMLFRLGQLNGTDEQNEPFISTSNPEYVKRYLEKHLLDRWAPHTYQITSNAAHMQITNQSKEDAEVRVCEFYSVGYYNVLIHFFYKIMLLKLSFEHSEIRWGKDKYVVDELIETITKFASRYYFDEVVVRTEGRETSNLLRQHFRIHEQYEEIRETLDELYRLQEDQEDERQSRFLFILTVYTVVSGIYGMNLIIEDWQGSIAWDKMAGYTVFEWIAWLLGITGILLSATIVGRSLYRGVTNFMEKKRREKWE